MANRLMQRLKDAAAQSLPVSMKLTWPIQHQCVGLTLGEWGRQVYEADPQSHGSLLAADTATEQKRR
jgi:hypothetical protein